MFSKPLQFQPSPYHYHTSPCVLEGVASEDSPSGPVMLLLFSAFIITRTGKKKHYTIYFQKKTTATSLHHIYVWHVYTFQYTDMHMKGIQCMYISIRSSPSQVSF